MKFDEGKLLLLFSGILTGVVITAFLINTKASPTRFLTLSDYQNTNAKLNELRNEIKGLYKEYGELNTKLYNYENGDNSKESVIKALEEELDDVKKLYGNTDVEGPGIKVTIDDRHKPFYFDQDDLMNSITHEVDLLHIVNDLKGAGAEAISINGKRIHKDTAFTCEGLIIEINGENVVPPFEVLAIGDPDGLMYSLSLEDSHYKILQFRKLELKTEIMNNIKIPSSGEYASEDVIIAPK